MKLTPEGERLYAHIRVAFEHIEAGEAEIIGSRNLEHGSVYVASSEIALHCMLLPVLKTYRRLYPGVRIRISNHSTPQAIEAIKDGHRGFRSCHQSCGELCVPHRTAGKAPEGSRRVQQFGFPGADRKKNRSSQAAGIPDDLLCLGYEVVQVLF